MQAHFPLQPTARKPPPRKPCHHGAFVISLVPRRRRRVWMDGWHLAAASRICGQERLRRWERFIHGPPPRRPHFSLVGPITCCFVPSCMHTSNGFCGRQAFSAALRRRKPASEERVRDGEDFPSSTRRPTPTRTSQRRWCANADRRNLGHDVLKFWFCLWRHITCRVVEVLFSFERGRRWHGRMLPLILEESSISLEVNYHYSSFSHDVCLSLFCLWPLSACIFYDVCLRMNLIRTDHLPSHHIHYFVIASLAMRSSQNDRLTSPSSR